MVRDAGAGGAGGARVPPSVGISVNPIRTKGADYARHITTVPRHLFGRCGVYNIYLERVSLALDITPVRRQYRKS